MFVSGSPLLGCVLALPLMAYTCSVVTRGLYVPTGTSHPVPGQEPWMYMNIQDRCCTGTHVDPLGLPASSSVLNLEVRLVIFATCETLDSSV